MIVNPALLHSEQITKLVSLFETFAISLIQGEITPSNISGLAISSLQILQIMPINLLCVRDNDKLDLLFLISS